MSIDNPLVSLHCEAVNIVCKSKNFGSWVYQLMIQFIVVSSFFLQDYISFILAWTFISLQIKEFRIMGLSINDSVYSCLFFFLTGLHFFHLLVMAWCFIFLFTRLLDK